MLKFPPFPELPAVAFAIIMALMFTPRLIAQEPPDDEAHAQVRKQIAEAKKKDDPKKQDPVNRNAAAERANAPNKKKNKAKNESDEKKSDDKKADDKKADDKKEDEKKSEESAPSVTHGSVEIDGQKIRYTATAGKMVMKTDEGDPKAHVFYVAYTKRPKNDDVSREAVAERANAKKDAASKVDATRPITFVFNGGPGSSSVWLHLGMLGP